MTVGWPTGAGFEGEQGSRIPFEHARQCSNGAPNDSDVFSASIVLCRSSQKQIRLRSDFFAGMNFAGIEFAGLRLWGDRAGR